MSKLIENDKKVWIWSVSRTNASVRYFFFNFAKSATKEPGSGHFGKGVEI